MLDVQRIQLDISKQPTPQQVRLGQGDANATRLIIDIFDDGTAYSLSGYSVRLEMRLPDSDSYYSTNGTSSGNTATFDIDETYAATSYGFNGFGYVDILDGDTVICSTSRFQLVVLRNAQDGADPSTAYSNGIIEATERAIAAAEAAEGVILQAVPTMSEYVKGGAKLGEGLTVEDETLSLEGESYTAAEKTKLAGIEDNANNYTLPTMGASTKGGAKLGDGLEVANDVLSLGAHEHSADDITSGVLPVDRGGTGSGTAAGARINLSVYSKSEVDTAVNGRLSDSGDTATGIYNFKSSNIDRDGADPSSDATGNSYLRLYDKDGEQIARLSVVRRTDGRNDLQLTVYNENNGTEVVNTLQIRVAKDGTGSYAVTNQSAFRSAIGLSDTPSKTSTVSDICTNGTDTTVTAANFARYGKVAMLEITCTANAAISSGGTVANIVSGKRPALNTNGVDTNSTYSCSIYTNGVVACRRALTSGGAYTFRATYIIA